MSSTIVVLKIPPNDLKKLGDNSAKRILLTEQGNDMTLKPFHQTHFGRLAPELREKVFIELLAVPPPYAGHDFATVSSASKKLLTAPKHIVHIKDSWYQVTQTCRQIYRESHYLFFASKAYYLANPQDLRRFLRLPHPPPRIGYFPSQPLFHYGAVTTLCLKHLIENRALYSREDIDEILSDPRDYRAMSSTRQELEAETRVDISFDIQFALEKIENLRMLCLCFRVGEEMKYIDLLFALPGMSRGLVEFLGPCHWRIRPQRDEDVWRIQYAIFTSGDYGIGKDNEEIPYDRMCLEKEVTDIDSRAPNLKPGDERYVEVHIQRTAAVDQSQDALDSRSDSLRTNPDLQTVFGNRDVDFSNPSDEDSLVLGTKFGDSDVDLFRASSDPTQLEPIVVPMEEDVPEETLEYDRIPSGTEPEIISTNHTSLIGLHDQTGSGPRTTADTNQAEEITLLPITHNAPTILEDEHSLLPDTEDEEFRVQIDAENGELDAPAASLQHIDYLLAGSALEAEQMDQNAIELVKEGSKRASSRNVSSHTRRPWLDLVDMRNPHTEEEMEWYEDWKERSHSGFKQEKPIVFHNPAPKPSPRLEKMDKHGKGTLCVPSTTTMTQQEHPVAVPQGSFRLLLVYIQTGGLFILFLLLVKIPELLSNGNRKRQDEGQQNQSSESVM